MHTARRSGGGQTGSGPGRRLALVILLAGLALAFGSPGPAGAQDESEPVVLVTTGNLHLRAAPSTASTIYYTAPEGTTVTATAISPNFRWLRVTYNGQGGWMARQHLELQSGDVATLPVSSDHVPPAVIAPVPVMDLDDVVAEALVDVYLRADPEVVEDDPETTFEETNIITYIPAGRTVSARSITPDGMWVFVQYGPYRGWVRGRYLNVVGGRVPPPFIATVPVDEGGIGFVADSTAILPGQCTTLRWAVRGDGSVYYKARSVASQGARRECPTQTTRYSLTVVRPGYQIEQRFVTVAITEARVDFRTTAEVIPLGQCVTLTWETQAIDRVYYNGEPAPVAVNGSREECPRQTTTYRLRAVTLTGQTIDRELTVSVYSGPQPGQQVIVSFYAVPALISPGQCTDVTWNTSGAVQIYYQGQPVGPSGARHECPLATTTYVLRVFTIDNRTLEYLAMVTVQ